MKTWSRSRDINIFSQLGWAASCDWRVINFTWGNQWYHFYYASITVNHVNNCKTICVPKGLNSLKSINIIINKWKEWTWWMGLVVFVELDNL